MFREIRLTDRVVNDEKAIEIITKGSYGVLSTIGEDGYPYGVPLNYTYFDNCICFHCAQEGHKLENINFNKKVSFCVVTKSDVLGNEFDTDYESAIAFGKATVVTDDSEKRNVLLSVQLFPLIVPLVYLLPYYDKFTIFSQHVVVDGNKNDCGSVFLGRK